MLIYFETNLDYFLKKDGTGLVRALFPQCTLCWSVTGISFPSTFLLDTTVEQDNWSSIFPKSLNPSLAYDLTLEKLI